MHRLDVLGLSLRDGAQQAGVGGNRVISFELSEEQTIAQATAKSIAEQMLRPSARDADEAARIPSQVREALWALGIVHAQSESADPVLNAIVIEELARGDAAFAISLASTVAFVRAIIDLGTPQQQALLLPQFTGEDVATAAIALTESSFGFDVANLATTATATGNGYTLNGKKAFVPLAGECSHFLVIARDGDSQQAFIVGRDAPGVTLELMNKPLGLKALQMAAVSFAEVEVGAEMKLGGPAGCDVRRIVNSARVGTGAVLVGMSRAVFEYVSSYTKDRVAHGTALARKQSVAFRIADMHIAIEAMRWMTWKAATVLAKAGRDATRDARLLQTYSGDQALWIADEGMQLLGGHGYLRDHPVELWYRNAQTITVLEGLAGV